MLRKNYVITSDNVAYEKTFKKREAVNNALENEFINDDEADALKGFLDEYYDDPKGLVQFVYDYMRDNRVPFVDIDKEALKNAFAEMVEQNYYLIRRR